MSQVKLTLRPPPNVDFVHGYPGIPPGGPDRPQAAVKGAIEVRAGPQGVKAKWVRIELRKVETLPGGGMSNTFYDLVSPSPVNLWTSSDYYGVLRTQDFPFSIRIPESIPPTIALENRAGIQYELVASLCTKGKKGFLRKRKSVVVSTQAAVIIDKHELHSTWPVYCQPETRQVAQGGCTLMVDRNQTCYGPGDRISVMALFRSDTVENTILRGFELTLKETSTFRAAHSGKKPVAPQVRVITISDSKLAINGTLHIGTEHRAELTCSISPNHTTTTLNSARHIDVTYVLCVKAILDNKSAVTMDLPLIVSNWQRAVSQEAIRRIGPTSTLSLLPIGPVHQTITRSEPAHKSPKVSTLPLSKDSYGLGHITPPNAFNTLPAQPTSSSITKVDEFGYNARPTHSLSNSIASDDLRSPTSTVNPGTGRRPDSVTGMNAYKATGHANEGPSEGSAHQQKNATTPTPNSTSPTTQGPWPSAEEEKQRLYEAARAKVERVQGSVARAVTPPVQTPPPTTSPTRNGQWPTAEEEKLRLFNLAQAAAKKTQGIASYSPPSPSHARNQSEEIPYMDLSSTSRSQPETKSQTTAAELYSQAMAARNQALSKQQQRSGPVISSQAMAARTPPLGTQQQQSAPTSPQRSPPKANVPQYLTAEQEKAALKRYHEAKMAVSRTQNEGYTQSQDGGSVPSSGPIAYEHLYPDNNASSSAPAPAPAPAPVSVNDLPPPFDTPANLIPASQLSEKERLHRAYEEQDAAAYARQNRNNASPPPFSQPAPTPAAPTNNSQGLSEKEILRRKFEAQDVQVLNASPGHASPPQPPPPRSNSATRSPINGSPSPRPKPAPPTTPGKMLTAAEEKALLKAQHAAQDARLAKQQQIKENGAGPSRPASAAIQTPPSPPLPPPLRPRPPVEYIQETQEEDARVSRFAMNGTIPNDDVLLPVSLKSTSPSDKSGFTPIITGFQHSIPPPPPLPPKPAGE